MRPSARTKCVLLLTVCLALPRLASASQITVGVANITNCVPFICATGAFAFDTYQQVYSNSAFPQPSTISAVTFFFDPTFSAGPLATGTFALSFSTTPAAVNALSTTFAANIGGSSQAFFSGALPAPGATSFTIPGTPYFYNPTLGNLLLTINYAGIANGFGFAQADNTGLVTSRMFGNSPTGLSNVGSFIGLVTQFDVTAVTAVPEPASLLLLGTGLAAGCVRRLRRQQKR